MRKANLKSGEIVQIPYHCFAPYRNGWNGWLFTPARVIKVAGLNKWGKKVVTLDVCNPYGKAGEHYEKNMCEDRIFAYHDFVERCQQLVEEHPASDFCQGRYDTSFYWLNSIGLLTGLR